MATLLKALNNLADIKSAGVLHFALELRFPTRGLLEPTSVVPSAAPGPIGFTAP
jgi:hypothetical protein